MGISERRLLGWEPQEFHEFTFDENGRHVGTIVTREPEWTDDERDALLALVDYEAHVCDCGLHESVANEDPYVQIEHRYCPLCASLAVAHRVQDAKDDATVKRLGEKPDPRAPRPDDGRHEWHRLMTPDEIAAQSKSGNSGALST